MKKTGPEKILTSDGIHLSPAGCKLMGAEVARVILEHLAKSDRMNPLKDRSSETGV